MVPFLVPSSSFDHPALTVLGLFFTICHMRELPLSNEPYDPEALVRDDREEERKTRAEYEIDHFIKCLEKDRGLTYIDHGTPDVTHRNDPRPDRILEEKNTGNMLVIEYAELRKSEKGTKQQVYELDKCGLIKGFSNPTPRELAERLVELIHKKRRKNQFICYPNTEKIYLFRNMWTLTIDNKLLYESSQYLEELKDLDCDHCYVILHKGTILEIF